MKISEIVRLFRKKHKKRVNDFESASANFINRLENEQNYTGYEALENIFAELNIDFFAFHSQNRVILQNTVIVGEGMHKVEKISPEEFLYSVKDAQSRNILHSYIGYQQNADILKEKGAPVKISRQTYRLRDGDTVLCMVFKTRLQNSKRKGELFDITFEDFDFYKIEITKPRESQIVIKRTNQNLSLILQEKNNIKKYIFEDDNHVRIIAPREVLVRLFS